MYRELPKSSGILFEIFFSWLHIFIFSVKTSRKNASCRWRPSKKVCKKHLRESNDRTIRIRRITWFVSWVRIVTSSIKKIFGKSVMFVMYVREVGANDWIKAGCFIHSFDKYEPEYPYFLSVFRNLSSNFLPSAHLTC